MGVEARCHPCHSAAHCWNMKRQSSLCHCCPCRGHHHCNCRCHLHVVANSVAIAISVAHRHCCRPLPLQLPSTIAAAISVALPSAIAVAVVLTLAVGHCRLRHHRLLQLLSPLAITITVTIGHFRELLPWRRENSIWPIEAKNAYLIFFCLDSGCRTDQSQRTDQVSSGDGQH